MFHRANQNQQLLHFFLHNSCTDSKKPSTLESTVLVGLSLSLNDGAFEL